MTILIYKTGGRISRSARAATLVAEIDVDPHELPYRLDRFARRHGGDLAEIQYDTAPLEELQPA